MKQPYENLPKVWAWDDDKKSRGFLGYHIKTNTSHFVVDSRDGLSCWVDNIEPYKEPTKRTMTHEEVFKMMQENLSNGKMTYFKDGDGYVFTYLDSSFKMNLHTYSTDLENWHPLEVEE